MSVRAFVSLYITLILTLALTALFFLSSSRIEYCIYIASKEVMHEINETLGFGFGLRLR